MLDNKSILITGGTGSFGQRFTEFITKNFKTKKNIIFSRDEFKQYEMSKKFPTEKYNINYFLGDIRDKDRLYRAFDGVDYVVHAAALKQVPALEYNPFEAVKTNILGAQNIIEAAIDKGVKKVVVLSTDKAVNPVNLYGATKLAMEKLFISACSYAGARDLSFCCVRYGNVVGSRGSIVPFLLDLKSRGIKEFPITDIRMTRFWITLDQGVDLVYKALVESVGGEIFIPKIPSMNIIDLANVIDSDAKHQIIGIRPGEKLHETLINEDEGRNTVDMGSHFVVLPQFSFEMKGDKYSKSGRVEEGFTYRSNTNQHWLKVDELKTMIKPFEV